MQTTLNPQAAPRLFHNRNFLHLFVGSGISAVGDQFSLIALPWLVLQLTHDSLALGYVMALMGIPRAVFILLGGALVDRSSPKLLMLVTQILNTLVLSLLAYLVWSSAIQIWMLYVIAAVLGLSSAFSMPAGGAILPRAVPDALLHSANSVMMGLRQTTTLLGPILAGAVIAASSMSRVVQISGPADSVGTSIAFAIDAASFAMAALMLLGVRLPALNSQESTEAILPAIQSAFRFLWNDRELRMLCMYFAAIACLVGGPLQVALPVLASKQLAGGATAFGQLVSGNGAGVIVGMICAGVFPKLRLKTLGMTMLALDAVSGLVLVPLGAVHSTWAAVALVLVLGSLGGFVQIFMFTWIQKRVPAAMMGRFMSVFMFVLLGMVPLASAAAGAMLNVMSVASLFAICGITLVMIVVIGALFSVIPRIDQAKKDQGKTGDDNSVNLMVQVAPE